MMGAPNHCTFQRPWQSPRALGQPDALDVENTRAMMGFLLFNRMPDTLAMVGLGGGSLAKFCHRHLPCTRITVVEINPRRHCAARRVSCCPTASAFA